MSGVLFFKFLKVIFLLHHSLFYVSILFLSFFSSTMFQMHLRLSNYILTFFVALRLNTGHGLLILEVSRSRTTTHHSR